MRATVDLVARRFPVAGIVHVQPGLAGAAAVVAVSPETAAVMNAPKFSEAEETSEPQRKRKAEKAVE
jgi:hypothetical protein